jgi:orotidine-5'-phosphate decarboxylase
MGRNFADELIKQIKEKKSIICIGLDPRFQNFGEKYYIPQFLEQEYGNHSQAILEFNKRLVDATSEFTPIYKPNIAFYELYDALSSLKDTIKYIHKKDALVIVDAKRGDIGSTCRAYALNLFKGYDADCITLNSYFGSDGVKPFTSFKEKGFFTQVKNSNVSSSEFQDLFSVNLADIPNEQISIEVEKIKRKSLILERNFIHMAHLVKNWGEELIGTNGYSSLGGVVGATFPEQMILIRKILDNCFLLIPGYGTQGATIEDVIVGVNKDGLGAIINSSRNIDFAYQIEKYSKKFSIEHFDRAAREAALNMRDEINKKLNL